MTYQFFHSGIRFSANVIYSPQLCIDRHIAESKANSQQNHPQLYCRIEKNQKIIFQNKYKKNYRDLKTLTNTSYIDDMKKTQA